MGLIEEYRQAVNDWVRLDSEHKSRQDSGGTHKPMTLEHIDAMHRRVTLAIMLADEVANGG